MRSKTERGRLRSILNDTHEVMFQTMQSRSGKLWHVEICFHKTNEHKSSILVVSEVPKWNDFRS
jgi:hypothetical protein